MLPSVQSSIQTAIDGWAETRGLCPKTYSLLHIVGDNTGVVAIWRDGGKTRSPILVAHHSAEGVRCTPIDLAPEMHVDQFVIDRATAVGEEIHFRGSFALKVHDPFAPPSPTP